MSAGFDFLGFHLEWKRKRGSNKWYVYTFIADRPFRSEKTAAVERRVHACVADVQDLLVDDPEGDRCRHSSNPGEHPHGRLAPGCRRQEVQRPANQAALPGASGW